MKIEIFIILFRIHEDYDERNTNATKTKSSYQIIWSFTSIY